MPTRIASRMFVLAAGCFVAIGLALATSALLWCFWGDLPWIKARKQAAAIARIEALGGKVEVYRREESIIGFGVDLSETNVSDDDLWALDSLEGMIRLNLAGTPITDKGVHILSRLGGRRHWWDLDLSKTLITDEAILSVEQLSPSSLNLSHTKITDAELHRLRSLNLLKHIDLSATRVGDEGLGHIAALYATQTPFQQDLNLSETAVTDEGLGHLQGLNLDELVLSRTSISDQGLARLENAGRISALHLADTRITDKGAESFARIKSLYTLVISRTAISDVGLAHMTTMERLGYLDVTGTQVTKTGVEDLRKALPKIHQVDGP